MPTGVYLRTEEHKASLKARDHWWLRGRTISESTKSKISRARRGIAVSSETRKKMSLSKKGKPSPRLGVKLSQEQIEKMRASKLGKPSPNKGRKYPQYSGENHPNWIKDRSSIRQTRRTHDPYHGVWRRQVYERDGHQCKLKDNTCHPKLEAHHIRRYLDFPELRYVVSNGITLCRNHHPRKRAEEDQLAALFISLVN